MEKKMENTLVKTTQITPADAGFGMYQTTGWSDEHYELIELISQIKENTAYAVVDIYELGVDKLPSDVEDIKGKVQDEPAKIFAVILDGDITYMGVSPV
jgi:hypothetical protein